MLQKLMQECFLPKGGGSRRESRIYAPEAMGPEEESREGENLYPL